MCRFSWTDETTHPPSPINSEYTIFEGGVDFLYSSPESPWRVLPSCADLNRHGYHQEGEEASIVTLHKHEFPPDHLRLPVAVEHAGSKLPPRTFNR